jgi:hypothetical protein
VESFLTQIRHRWTSCASQSFPPKDANRTRVVRVRHLIMGLITRDQVFEWKLEFSGQCLSVWHSMNKCIFNAFVSLNDWQEWVRNCGALSDGLH